MKSYVAFLDTLQRLAETTGCQPDPAKLTLALDGQASQQLRDLVPIARLRTQGAFFTDSSRAERLIASIPPERLLSGVIIDPQCGAGNLLLAAARKLPVADSPETTIREWGKRLGGIDCDSEFVSAAKSRLWLLAVQRSPRAPVRLPDLDAALPLMKTTDSLSETTIQPVADVLLLNPPYGLTVAPKDCRWASGSVSASAVFVADALSKCKPGCTIAAILPDVLRSGTRYQRWRRDIESLAAVERADLGGVFDAQTDIDVFSVQLRRSNAVTMPAAWAPADTGDAALIGDKFNVHVGPLVPFRHAKRGPILPYLTMKELHPWKRLQTILHRRRFSGTTYTGPFVAVRRVSRPNEAFRALATLIDIREPVAVENHILICQPKDGRLGSCSALLKSLKHHATNDWLNQSICCRHLTTQSLLRMPLFG